MVVTFILSRCLRTDVATLHSFTHAFASHMFLCMQCFTRTGKSRDHSGTRVAFGECHRIRTRIRLISCISRYTTSNLRSQYLTCVLYAFTFVTQKPQWPGPTSWPGSCAQPNFLQAPSWSGAATWGCRQWIEDVQFSFILADLYLTNHVC